MSDDRGYAWLQAGAARHGFDPLPTWKDVPADAQEHVLGVLRRLSLSRAVNPQDGLGTIEREVGIGEDRALRLHLLLTCFEIVAEALAPAPATKSRKAADTTVGDPFLRVLSTLVSDETREWIAARCWVYRDDPLLAWDGLEEVGTGFTGNNGEALDRLAAARGRWDALDGEDRLREVTSAMRAVMLQYTAGVIPFGRTTHSVWGNVALLRKFAEAARADRINLLSETAFASIRERDLPAETFRGVTVTIDDDELFVSRAELSAAKFPDWSTSLMNWKPRADGGGETIFAWSWGGALVLPEAPAAERLEGWLQEALCRIVAESGDAGQTVQLAGAASSDAA